MRFASAAAFEAWLADEHATSDGIWIEFAKKGNPTPSVTYAEAVEVALCFGWIDGQLKKGEEEGWYRQRFTPRRPRSKWSLINRERAEALIAAGRMRPAGLAEVERAKDDGRWAEAYPPPSRMEVPDDLQAALDASPAAAAAFAELPGSRRYGVLYRIHDAKRPETRARRIAALVEKLARREPVP